MIRRLRIALLAAALGAWVILVPPAQAGTLAVEIRTFAVLPQTGAEMTLFGSVTGAGGPTRLQIQHYTSGSWKRLADVTTGASGDYSHSFVVATSGTTPYRSVVPATESTPVTTSAVKRVYIRAPASTPFDSAPSPTVSGSHVVGGRVTAEVEPWSPQPARYQYRWNRDGVPLTSYGRQHTVTSDDFGKHLTVSVVAYRSESATYRESRPLPPVAAGTFTAENPIIVGRPSVGETLRADVSSWSPKPTTLTHRWMRDGMPIDGATAAEYIAAPADQQTSLTVEVHAEGVGLQPVTRTSTPVTIEGTQSRTFADVIEPRSTSLLSANEATYQAIHTPPGWANNVRTRWDTAGAFTHSLAPQPLGTLVSDYFGADYSRPQLGAEYVATDSVYRNADVSFTVTARRFAIAYRTYTSSDAMVWIDDRPIAAAPIAGKDLSTNRSGTANWIVVTLPERKTVTVRFAGPHYFTGVDAPAADSVQVSAAPPRFTLGIVSDSLYTTCAEAVCMSRSPAPVLSTLTGFRVWNLAEGGSGYLTGGGGFHVPGHESTPFGSQRRLDALKAAPIDALLVNGSANDGRSTTVTSAEHRAAVDDYLAKVKELRPDLPVILVGIEPIAFTRTVHRASHYAGLTANLDVMVGRHRTVQGFIDPYTDPWLTGTGSTQAPKGDGNQDVYIGSDGYHPNVAGTAYYQGRIVDELKDLPLPESN